MSRPTVPELRTPSVSELLDVWDTAHGLTIARRAALLVGLACPNLSADGIAQLPLGKRDALLLRSRRLLFGDPIEAISGCPRCGETVETRFSLEDLSIDAPAAAESNGCDKTHECYVGAWCIRYRLPTSADATALADTVSADARSLIERCLIEASCAEPLASSEALPEPVLAAIAHGIVSADPHADILLDLVCPACAHRWSAPFEAVAFLWTEINTWARRTLREVALLARAFGWREADILALSPQRRSDYLELVGA
jgi:hypothetical protein